MRRTQFHKMLTEIGVNWLPGTGLSVKTTLPERRRPLYQCHLAGYQFFDFKKLANALQKGTRVQLKTQELEKEDMLWVYHQGERLGFVPADKAAVLIDMIKNGYHLAAVVAGIDSQAPAWERVTLEIVEIL